VPTILKVGAYRVFFYAGDWKESPHVHVERDDYVAKFWLNPVRLVRDGGFPKVELHKIQNLVVTHEPECLRKWNEFFKN
jgi:hypothetical protein